MTRIKGVIFDLDGTLIDSLETYTQALNQGLSEFNLGPVSKQELAAFLNQAVGIDKILQELFPVLSEDRETRRHCLDEILRAYLEQEEKGITLKPGCKEILSLLQGMGLKIGIATGRTTSGDRKWLELRRLNIDHFIDAMITGAEAQRKPAPDGVIKCIEELGLAAQDCVFVGDSQADIVTGKAAGVITIAIATGVAKQEALSQEGPNAIISSLTELPSKIEEITR